MMIRAAAVLAIVGSVSAKSFVPKDLKTDSAMGKKLMSKARKLEQNGQNQQQQERENSWMAGYSMKYVGCSSIPSMREEGGGGEEGNFYTQNLVKFVLCPADTCDSSCTSGEAQYVVNMMDFVDTYTEMQMNAQEQACENMREYGCYCENANDDEACENACYAEAGMEYCIEYEGQEEFEIQRYLECAELEAGENNNNQNNGNGNGNYYNNYNNDNGVNMNWQYYVGMTCADDGYSINLAVFSDMSCSTKAASGTYEAFNYGRSLPFENEPIVKSDCISCLQVDENQNNNNNNNNGNQQDAQLSEICEQMDELSAKCESAVSTNNYYFYPDNSGCDFINNVLPRMDKATRKISSGGGGGSSGSQPAAVALAVIFSITTAVLAAYSFFLYRKIHRAKVNLAHSEGHTMA